KIGDTFFGTHGNNEEGEVHDDHAYKVVGILKPSGKVADQLILCTIESVWYMHEHGHDHHEHNNDEHDHHHDEESGHTEKEITAVILKLQNNIAKVTWQRIIPQNTEMQAASPAIEINRLFALFGVGISALKYLRSEEHTSELQSRENLVCRLLLEKKKS